MDLTPIAREFGVPLAAFLAFTLALVQKWLVLGWVYDQTRADLESQLNKANSEVDEWKAMALALLRNNDRAISAARRSQE